jgi:hypothetical protein
MLAPLATISEVVMSISVDESARSWENTIAGLEDVVLATVAGPTFAPLLELVKKLARWSLAQRFIASTSSHLRLWINNHHNGPYGPCVMVSLHDGGFRCELQTSTMLGPACLFGCDCDESSAEGVVLDCMSKLIKLNPDNNLGNEPEATGTA